MLNLLRGVIMTSALLTSGEAPDDRGPTFLLADFPAAAEDLPWHVVNDDVMGGRSEGEFRLEEGWLLFTGRTNTDGGGFASIRSRPRRFALEGWDGIRLRVRGDGRTYTFRLTTAARGERSSRVSYWADFEAPPAGWRVVDVPFSRFRPRWRGRWLDGPEFDPGLVDGLGLMIYDQRDGPFRLEVDWIRAYRVAPFSLSDYRWRRRPLLLFAGDGTDSRLREQIAAVEATRDQFEERDMELIVVLGRGSSPVTGVVLTGDDADRLRASYDVGAGAFALRLVGKDGGVKHAGTGFVPMGDLYELIDAMPMRQEEMRRP